MNDPTTSAPRQATSKPAQSASLHGPIYTSPILQQLAPGSWPQPSPACETCPASVWFASKQVLKCFCTRMHVIVWDNTNKEPPIMMCDGREIALTALLEQATS